MSIATPSIPKAFIWKRAHSLMGLWLTGFLIIHLFANSQLTLFAGENTSAFIKVANDIRNLPFLPVLEVLFLAVPFAIHVYWGISYLFTGKINSYRTDGTRPELPEYSRNHAYTWQRITSWILLFLIAGHVIQMRFLEAPKEIRIDNKTLFAARVYPDRSLSTVAKALDTWVYEKSKAPAAEYLRDGQVLVVARDFGTAEMFMVRETFKNPLMVFLYTILVLSACFHGFNGLWTFMISWGVTLSQRGQRIMRHISTGIMFAISFLGLAAIWGTYLSHF